jgi:pyruvate,orthophosphate dikinase
MAHPNHPTFLIGCGTAAAQAPSLDEMGFKGYNLWRMERIGLPVPPAFTLGTGFCREYFRHGAKPMPGLRDLLAARMRDLERASGLAFGSTRLPLLVSVRSGAPVSMPGMMETVLNIGLSDAVVPGLLRLTGNPRLVWDSYRRLVQSFGEVVHQIAPAEFDAALAARLDEAGQGSARELDFQSLRRLTRDFLDVFEKHARKPFPQGPLDQLEAAVGAVWASWRGAKAVEYRRMNGLSDDIGTAVTVQRMVYGNAGGTSGAGVAFTRDPATGEKALYLDFSFNAQGEDIVSGRRSASDGERLTTFLPQVHERIGKVSHLLEQEFADMQEFEFTVQDAKLYLLQTRAGKRMPWAALRIAVEQLDEGLIGPDEARRRLAGIDLAKIERLRVVEAGAARRLCRAISAGIGVAVGEIALDSERAQAVERAGRRAILVRDGTLTDDIKGIAAAEGVLTATGGRTSHAAVVARQLGKVCLVGCDALVIDLAARRCAFAGEWLAEGDVLSLDGHNGEVYAGAVKVITERPLECLERAALLLEPARAA